jgi:hypothetical protein
MVLDDNQDDHSDSGAFIAGNNTDDQIPTTYPLPAMGFGQVAMQRNAGFYQNFTQQCTNAWVGGLYVSDFKEKEAFPTMMAEVEFIFAEAGIAMDMKEVKAQWRSLDNVENELGLCWFPTPAMECSVLGVAGTIPYVQQITGKQRQRKNSSKFRSYMIQMVAGDAAGLRTCDIVQSWRGIPVLVQTAAYLRLAIQDYVARRLKSKRIDGQITVFIFPNWYRLSRRDLRYEAAEGEEAQSCLEYLVVVAIAGTVDKVSACSIFNTVFGMTAQMPPQVVWVGGYKLEWLPHADFARYKDKPGDMMHAEQSDCPYHSTFYKGFSLESSPNSLADFIEEFCQDNPSLVYKIAGIVYQIGYTYQATRGIVIMQDRLTIVWLTETERHLNDANVRIKYHLSRSEMDGQLFGLRAFYLIGKHLVHKLAPNREARRAELQSPRTGIVTPAMTFTSGSGSSGMVSLGSATPTSSSVGGSAWSDGVARVSQDARQTYGGQGKRGGAAPPGGYLWERSEVANLGGVGSEVGLPGISADDMMERFELLERNVSANAAGLAKVSDQTHRLTDQVAALTRDLPSAIGELDTKAINNHDYLRDMMMVIMGKLDAIGGEPTSAADNAKRAKTSTDAGPSKSNGGGTGPPSVAH